MVESHPIEDRVIALGAAFLSARVVQDIARTGTTSEPQMTTLLNSLLNTSPESAEAVYTDINAVEKGLKLLVAQFDKNGVKDPELLRYILSLFALERKLSKKPKMLDFIAKRIEQAKYQASHFGVVHDNTIANFADIYSETISKFHMKIHVIGNPMYLTHQPYQNKVRAILLAGIRAVVLWRQSGGSRLHLIFNRDKYIKSAENLLLRRLTVV